MKAIKKILAVLLAGALVFGFAACSSDDDGGNSSSETGKTGENSGSETENTGGSSGDTKVEKPAASEILASFKGTIPTKGEYVLYYLKSNLAVVEIVDEEIFLKGSYTGDISKDGEGTVYLKADDGIDYFWELTGNDLKLYGKESGSTYGKKLISTFTRVSENSSDSGETKEKPSESAASSQDNPFKGTEWMCYDLSNVYNSVDIQIEKDKLKGVMICRLSDYKADYKDNILSESYTVTKNGDSYTASSKDFSITINSKDAKNGVITCSHFGLNNAPIAKRK